MRRVLLPILLLLFPLSAFAQSAWPGFRGPSGQGIVPGDGFPTTWDDSHAIVWKTPIAGKAWSSPVILGDEIWLTNATPEGHRLSVLCIDRRSGKVLRDQLVFEIPSPQYCHPFNSYASPTPVIEPGRLYASWGSAGTACIDTHTGRLLWTRTDLPCNHWRGPGSSPLIYRDLMIMHFDGADQQYVIALDKNTGRTVWKTPRSVDFQDLGPDGLPKSGGDWRKAFSTPRIYPRPGGDLLISLGSKCLYAYNPLDGKEIWCVVYRGSHSGPTTPIIGDGLIIYGTGLDRPELWAVTPEGKVVWKSIRNAPGRASPLLVGDLVYTVDDAGIARCVEARTGEEVWRHRIKGNYSASPMCASGRIYFFSQEGTTYVLAPGREFKLLAENQLPDGFMATPAALDGAFYLRTKAHLYRIQDLNR